MPYRLSVAQLAPLALAFSMTLSAAGALSAQTQKAAPPQGERRPAQSRAGGIQGSELVIVVNDKGFEAPEQVDAGLVNIRLFNRSSAQQHFSVLKVDRLDRLAQISDYLRSGDWNVPWINRMGGPESTPSGGVSSVSMVLEPGRYVIAQLPVNPNPGGPLILSEVRELSVTRRPGASALPALPGAEVTLKMFEWNYTLEGPLNAGRRTIRVDNTGQFEHHVWIVRLLPGKTLAEAVKWAEKPVGAPPFEGVGGTTNMARGRSVNVTVDLLPGEYALLCVSYNPLSKRLHSQHGMIKAIRVTP
ncbi:MAG TPA: hypothetical protein VFV33_20855 [Gemmatimonadaceae bacterium]|nr:hypothetical protein [Gemmatimonadaceae bacterium]